jgi:hypothetical protein
MSIYNFKPHEHTREVSVYINFMVMKHTSLKEVYIRIELFVQNYDTLLQV